MSEKAPDAGGVTNAPHAGGVTDVPDSEGVISAAALRQLRATVRDVAPAAPASAPVLVGASTQAAAAGLAPGRAAPGPGLPISSDALPGAAEAGRDASAPLQAALPPLPAAAVGTAFEAGTAPRPPMAAVPPSPASLSSPAAERPQSWRPPSAPADAVVGEASTTASALPAFAGTTPDPDAPQPRDEDPAAPSAQAPMVQARNVVGAEDSAIALDLAAALRDTDGSEALALSLLGVPEGAVLSAGVRQEDGSWSLLPGELAGLTLTPPRDFAGAIALTLRATSTEASGGDSALVERAFTVQVAAVVDGASLSGTASGAEDHAIPILASFGVPSDASEGWEPAAIVRGVPSGAVLSQGTALGGGVWQVDQAELAAGRVAITPPTDFAGAIALTIEARLTDTEGAGTTQLVTAAVTVQVAAVADAPVTSANDVAGEEDNAVALDLAAALTDADGSEALALSLLGVPDGAVLSAGSRQEDGTWSLLPDELAGLTLTPPRDFAGAIALTLRATSTEPDSGDTAVGTTIFTVQVAAVADAPEASADAASGTEDSAIALDLAAALTDTDGSEALALSLLGVPDGAVLSAGVRQDDGSWSLLPGELAGLTLAPPRDFAGAIALTLRATSTEALGGDAAVTTADFIVQVAAVADAASIVARGNGVEDSWIPIHGSLATTDLDGSESLGVTLTVTGVPTGALLSHGTEIAPGTWSIGRDVFEAGLLAIRPPVHSDLDFNLQIALQTRDGEDTTVTQATARIAVRAAADAPRVQVADAHGSEDTPIRLAGLGGALTDTDGSERLSFRLMGVPSTATLSAGTRNGDGSWTLTPAQLASVSLTPPPQFSGTMSLTLAAISTESRDGRPQASTAASFTVAVDPVADAGSIAATASGDEDGWIGIRPTFATPDTDGSERWSATTLIAGVPTGATLNAGTEIAPGEWEVPTADLRDGLVSIRPPEHSDDDFTLTLRATLQDTGNGRASEREVTGSHTVSVTAVADAPDISAGDVVGNEDTAIALNLAAALVDGDGSEQLTLALLGVPAGALLSAGTRQEDGSWSVTADQLDGLTITPPRDFSGTIDLTLHATASDHDRSTAIGTAAFSVQVDAVADAPTLRVGATIGAEDAAIGLRISGATTDIDGSEVLVGFRIHDLPDGAVLRAGGAVLARESDGSVLVHAADAPTLSVTPPPDGDADFTLRVACIAEEPNGSRAEGTPRDLPVHVTAVADAPVWLRLGTAGAEDAPIPLDIGARLADTDGSEALSFVVSGLPAGAVLSAGTYRGPGSWSLTAAEAETATLMPPTDFAGTITLTVTAVAQEGDGGHQAVSTVSFPVHVAATIDSGNWSAGASGHEDQPIALSLAPQLRDGDGSERLVGDALVEGVPAGAVLRLATGAEVVASEGVHRIPVDQLAGVTITMPADSDVVAQLQLRVTVEDTGGVQAQLRGTITVDPRGVADMPGLEVSGVTLAGHGSDDAAEGWARLPVSAALADTDGSETLHVWIRDVPSGFALSAGTPGSGGAWLLRAADLTDLEIRPPAGFAGSLVLRVQAVATEREGDSGVAPATLSIEVTPPSGRAEDERAEDDGRHEDDNRHDNRDNDHRHDNRDDDRRRDNRDDDHRRDNRDNEHRRDNRDDDDRDDDCGREDNDSDNDGPDDHTQLPPTLTLVAGSSTEDRSAPLAIRVVAASRDDRDTPPALGVQISGVPAGARLSAGTHDSENDVWVLRPEELDGLQLIPPRDFAGDIALRVTALAVGPTGVRTTTQDEVVLGFEAVADSPSTSASPPAGVEDRAVPLNLGVAARDADGSESVVAITLSGLAPGAAIAAGPGIGDNGDGTWTVEPWAAGTVRLIPPPDAHGTFSVTVTATIREASNGATSTNSRSVGVTVAPVADAPVVTVADATGHEDQAIPLVLDAVLADRDGSEALSVVISGLPDGARLSAGINNGDGSWTLTRAQLSGLTVTSPANWSGEMALALTAHALERSTGAVTTTEVPFSVSVAGVADTPLVDAETTASAAEDQPVALDIVARLADPDASETLAVVVSGVPAGAIFSAGSMNPDGSWIIPGTALPGLTFTPPSQFSGTLQRDVAVTGTERDGDMAAASFQLAVTVDPVADAPVISLAGIAGDEDTPIRLPLAATLVDADGSESIVRFVVTGLPQGAALSAGTAEADGSWTLTAAEAPDVSLLPAPNWSGAAELTVTAILREAADGSEADSGTTLSVTINPVTDAAALTAKDVTGAEDTAIALNLGAALADTDGSETLSVSLLGVPAGFALSAGTRQGDGTWSLAPGGLAGLTLTAPADWNGTLNLALRATSQDGTTTATTTRSFAVTVTPVNDAPLLALGAAPQVAAGVERAAATGDASLSDEHGTRMGGATITLSGGEAGERLVFDGLEIRAVGGRLLIGDTGIEMDSAPDGTVTLSGAAPMTTYEGVLEALAIENAGGLAAGTRSIGVTLRDEEGAAAATQLVALRVEPSLVAGGPADALLAGIAGHDTFAGGTGNETMQGGAGADLFVIGMDGSRDRAEGGTGSWIDTVHVEGTGTPDAGSWTLVLDGDPQAVHGERSFDFAEPVSGHIHFADGTQVELAQIERITW
ncbi:hypothetical protein [Falsiroseomonas sp.]|uniref:hypothetical protein n=1 Tax=Falsiroseomonas sp. TaxID=2870721 RepID=UPI00356B26F7